MTIMKKITKIHASIPHTQAINQICEPLFANTRITYFAHVVLDDMNRLASLSSSDVFTNLYYQKEHYNNDIHALQFAPGTQKIIWDLMPLTGKTKELDDDHAALNLGHTYSIIRRENGHTECFHFSGKLGDQAINGLYGQYNDFLENFILYFKDKIHAQRELMAIYDDRYVLNLNNAECQFETDMNPAALTPPNLKADKYFLPGGRRFLSRREISCLYWLANGKTMEETALLLGITRRTVKAHIENTKIKLGCFTLFQLGQAYHKLELWRLLDGGEL